MPSTILEHWRTVMFSVFLLLLLSVSLMYKGYSLGLGIKEKERIHHMDQILINTSHTTWNLPWYHLSEMYSLTERV